MREFRIANRREGKDFGRLSPLIFFIFYFAGVAVL